MYLVPPTSTLLLLQCPRSGRLGRLSGILFYWEGLCEHVASRRTVSAQPGTQGRGLGFSPLTPLLKYYRPRKLGGSPTRGPPTDVTPPVLPLCGAVPERFVTPPLTDRDGPLRVIRNDGNDEETVKTGLKKW